MRIKLRVSSQIKSKIKKNLFTCALFSTYIVKIWFCSDNLSTSKNYKIVK